MGNMENPLEMGVSSWKNHPSQVYAVNGGYSIAIFPEGSWRFIHKLHGPSSRAMVIQSFSGGLSKN